MTLHKSSLVVMMLLLTFSPTLYSANHQSPSSHTAYHEATDKAADVFGAILYPIKMCWEKIVDTLSPHHPIIKDIKNTADYIGQKIPTIAEEIVIKMRNKCHEINDYVMQEAEITAQRISERTAQAITTSATKALERTQQTIEESVKQATQDATVQIKQAHQEMLNTTQATVREIVAESTQKIELATHNIMENVHHTLQKSGKDMAHQMAQEFEVAADRITLNTVAQLNTNIKINTTFAAKTALLTATGSSGLIMALFGSHHYMTTNNSHSLGFVTAGMAITAVAYKALEAIS